MEDAYSTGADEKAHDDQDDAPQELLPENGEDATDYKDRRDDPQDGCHDLTPFKASITPELHYATPKWIAGE